VLLAGYKSKSLVATSDSNEALNDNTSSIASRRSSCIVDAPHLSAPGGRASTHGGSTMRRYAILFAVVFLLLPLTVYSQSRTPEAALNLFKNALKKGGSGDLDGAIEDYTRAIRLSSHLNESKDSDSRLGNSLTDYSADNVTVVDPFTANAYNNRGLARFKKDDIEGAIEDYNQALKIRPALANTYMNRAAALRSNGDLQGALRDLDRAIELKRDFFEAYSNRGSLKLDLEDTAGALDDLNRSIELNNRIPEPFYQRGYVFMALKDFDRSIVDFDHAIKLAPDMAWAYQGRGTAYMYKGKMLEAIADFNRSIEFNPQIAWAYFNRGLANVYLGNESEAQRDFDESLRLRPDMKAQLEQRIQLARQLRRIGNLKP
jgi:tetratricopeptide (TPR) repeat protein